MSFSSKPQGGGGQFFFIPSESTLTATFQKFLPICGFFSGNFSGITTFNIFADFSSYSLHICTFLLYKKGSICIWQQEFAQLKQQEPDFLSLKQQEPDFLSLKQQEPEFP